MLHKIKIFCVSLFTLALLSCQGIRQVQVNSDDHLMELVNLMSGEFNSLEQSKVDSDYFYISLKMNPIWQDLGEEGHWLYVEQAVGNRLDKPYRQRIYHVTQIDSQTFSSEVYELPDAASVVGANEDPELLEDVSPVDLIIRTGCAVVLKRTNPMHYEGSTNDKACLSQLRGATYATSIVRITPNAISSWDQGFDANDLQVWGAVKGPYIFVRE